MVTLILHIVPAGDLVEHEATSECICGPTTDIIIGENGETQWHVTHHALDGRDRGDWVRETGVEPACPGDGAF